MPRPGENIPRGKPIAEKQSFESLLETPRSGSETGVVKSFPIRHRAKTREESESSIVAALTKLRNGKRTERIGAARELGDIALTQGVKIPEAVIPLGVSLSTDNDPHVREEAAWALWKLGEKRAQRSLMNALLDDPSPAVREKCARVLGLMGLDESLPIMVDMLTLERHVPARVRAGIACAFGYLAREHLLDHVMRLARDAEPRVRYEAVRSLGRYLVGFSEEITEKVFRFLRRYLRTGHEPCALIRKAAVKALRFSRNAQATRSVIRVLRSDPDSEARQTAADTLLIWDDADSEGALIGALTDDCWQVRKAAARNLAKFIVRYRVYDGAAVCEALRRMERMLPAHSLEWRLAAEAFVSL